MRAGSRLQEQPPPLFLRPCGEQLPAAAPVSNEAALWNALGALLPLQLPEHLLPPEQRPSEAPALHPAGHCLPTSVLHGSALLSPPAAAQLLPDPVLPAPAQAAAAASASQAASRMLPAALAGQLRGRDPSAPLPGTVLRTLSLAPDVHMVYQSRPGLQGTVLHHIFPHLQCALQLVRVPATQPAGSGRSGCGGRRGRAGASRLTTRAVLRNGQSGVVVTVSAKAA